MKTLLLTIALCAGTTMAQQSTGTVKGQVLDELGGALVGASVVATDTNGKEITATTNDQGLFVIGGLEPGKYKMHVAAAGFAGYENPSVEVVAGRTRQLDITLEVTIEEQKVTVNSDSPTLSTEPENNVGAIVLKGADLDALPDDPDDLAAALQALAGPSAGPNGGQIFIDGFSGGRLPPLSSIREIRINANPFSAEYDRMGFGRIEIFTKPGTDKFRGQASFNFNDNSFNSRNPFAPERPPFESRQYSGNLSGPISKKKASFFVDFEKRDINDEALINATILDLIIAASGSPFNITIGRDLNGDTLFTERPAFATDLTTPGVVITQWGAFDPNPLSGEQIIPRNLGTGPGSLTTRLGISKTFGFGRESSASSGQRNRRGGDGGGAGGRGPLGIAGIGGGPRGGGGGGRCGGSFGGGDTGKRYNLTFSINIQNPLNHANLGRPDGNLSSPFFGLSTSSGGNFGGFGGAPGSSAYDRRIDAQLRFSF